MAVDGMVYRPALLKVTQGKSKTGKIVRGTHDLLRPVGCCARKRDSHLLILQNRYIDLVHTSHWS